MTDRKQRWIIHDVDTYIRFPNFKGNIKNLPKENFWIEMEFNVGLWNFEFDHGIESQINVFGLEVVTVDYLKKVVASDGLVSPNFVVIVEEFVEDKIIDFVNTLLDQCSSKDWKATSKFLSFLMSHNYSSYITPNFE